MSDVARMVTVPLPGRVVVVVLVVVVVVVPPGMLAGSAGSLPASSSSRSRKPSSSRSMPMRVAGARRHAGVGELLARRWPPARAAAASVSSGLAGAVALERRRWRAAPSRAARRRRVPFTTRSHSPASARAISRSMRGPTRARRCVASSVICWPTIGARLVSNASMNCSRSARSVVADVLNTVRARWKRKTVSMLPSCRKPKPRTCGPWCAVVAGADERDRRHAEHADLLVHVAQVRRS